jgi:putative ABC transport system ATP-binding protein
MLIHAVNLTKIYPSGSRRIHAVNAVSLDVAGGEFIAIMGPSGSGKSTLLNLLGLLDRPTSGRLEFNGEDVTHLSADRRALLRNRYIGFVFQEYNLLPRSTALENVELPLVYGEIPAAERKRRAETALEKVGLADRGEHWPAQLSGGEQQRVAIARSMVLDPELVLADEPTGALDSRTGQEILGLFEQLNGAGCSIILVTHDAEVAAYAHRTIAYSDGMLLGDHRKTLREKPSADETGDRGISGTFINRYSEDQ